MEVSDALGVAGLVVLLTAAMALTVGPSIWGLVDASRMPDVAWSATRQKRNTWLVLFAVGLWAWFVGVPSVIVYATRVRPRLRRASDDLGVSVPNMPWIVAASVLIGLTAFSAFFYVMAQSR